MCRRTPPAGWPSTTPDTRTRGARSAGEASAREGSSPSGERRTTSTKAFLDRARAHAENLAPQRFDLPGAAVPRELARARGQRVPQALALAQRALESVRDRHGIARIDLDPVTACDLRLRAPARHEHRRSTRESLEHRQPEALGARQHRHDAREAVERRQIALLDLVERRDVARQPEARDEAEVAAQIGSVAARDDELHGRTLALAQLRQPRDHRGEILLFADRAEAQRERRLRQPIAAEHDLVDAARGRLLLERKGNAPRTHDDRGPTRPTSQVARDERGRGDDARGASGTE